NFEYVISAKSLELLKQIAPGLTRVAVLGDSAIAAGAGQLGAMQAVAPSLGVELSPIGVRDAREIERAIAAFARSPNGGLILTASALAPVHRDLIITLAARHRLPAVSVPTRRGLCRPYPQGREGCQAARAVAGKVRTRRQSQDRQGARPDYPGNDPRPRRRGHRVKLRSGSVQGWFLR